MIHFVLLQASKSDVKRAFALAPTNQAIDYLKSLFDTNYELEYIKKYDSNLNVFSIFY